MPCQFCRRAVDEPTAFEQVRPCECGALCWLEFADDLSDVPLQAMEELGAASVEEIDVEVIRDYDVMLDDEEQPVEEGIEVCLVFVRLKSA